MAFEFLPFSPIMLILSCPSFIQISISSFLSQQQKAYTMQNPIYIKFDVQKYHTDQSPISPPCLAILSQVIYAPTLLSISHQKYPQTSHHDCLFVFSQLLQQNFITGHINHQHARWQCLFLILHIAKVISLCHVSHHEFLTLHASEIAQYQ